MIMQVLSETLSSEAGSAQVKEKAAIKNKSFRGRKTLKRSLETEPSPRVYNYKSTTDMFEKNENPTQ